MTSPTQKSQGCGYNERIVQHNLHVKPDLPPTAGQHDHNSYRGSYRVKSCHPVKFNFMQCAVGKISWSLEEGGWHHQQWSPVIIWVGCILSAAQIQKLIKWQLGKPSTTERTSPAHHPLSLPPFLLSLQQGCCSWWYLPFRATRTRYVGRTLPD